MAGSALLYCFLACLPLCVVTRSFEKAPVKNEKFDYLTLSQFWPATSCIYFAESGCIVPEAVKGWTIHGLWPSNPGHEQPEECNKSMPFNYTEIQGLRSELDLKWPYYNKSATDHTFLWAHEWEKHGTCAYSLPPLQGEMNYFTKTMQLYSGLKRSIADALADYGITPSKEKMYEPEAVFNAIKATYGKIPVIACFYEKSSHRSYLDQIYLCFDKQLKLRDCDPVEITSSHLRKLKKQSGGRHKEDQVLRFQTEKDDTASKSHTYFSDCPGHNNTVHFLPIEYGVVVEREEIFIEREFYKKVIWQ